MKITAKLCTKCGLVPPNNPNFNAWCKPCNAQVEKDKRAKYIAAGLCPQCAAPRGTDTLLCQICRDKANGASILRRQITKLAAIQYMGGCCADCQLVSEYHAIYDFHHLDPSSKDFSIGTKCDRMSVEELHSELDKCVLLCSNCHRIRHAKENRN